MKATFTFHEPENIMATMSITMRVKDWHELNGQLTRIAEWPACDLSRCVDKVIRSAKATIYGEQQA